nr:immunoglobulin heavy chain junction region [Mus musculus]
CAREGDYGRMDYW